MMRMWQGAFGLSNREGLVSPAYVVLKPTRQIVPEYAAQLLRTPRMLYLLWAYSYGLTDDRLRLYYSDLAAIRVSVPEIAQQRRIARLLITWDQAIDTARRLVGNSIKQRDALLRRVFSGGVDERSALNPSKTLRLGDLIGQLNSGVSVNGFDRLAMNGEVGVLKVSAVTSGTFDPLRNKAILPDEIERVRVSPRADRIIVSRSNTAELLGASAYIEHDYPTLFLSDKLWQLEPKEPKSVHMRWLANWLSAPATRTRISALASGSSGSMKNIGKDQLLALEIKVPQFEDQERIANALGDWDRSIVGLNFQTEALIREKRVLMNQLVTGKRRLPLKAQPAETTA